MRRLLVLLASVALAVGVLPAVAHATPGLPAQTTMRVATFNVRTARATWDRRNWLERVPDVAREILNNQPGIVMLQELGPGRADGKRTKIKSSLRQTTSLTTKLAELGGSQYKLVRTTSYVKPGKSHGTQGSRILYDSSRFTLLSDCPDTTGKSNWNTACSLELPLAAGDGPSKRRSAAYAAFGDRTTGQQFWVASAHLDDRHSSSSAKEAKYNRLRYNQAAYVADQVAASNPGGLPVIFGGDINSWQTDRGHYAPHRALADRSYVDAATAPTKINYGYPTVNHFKSTLRPSKSPYGGVRLDVVMVRGAQGFTTYQNTMQNPDSARPSDHNMVVADLSM